jgi:hypothetical protein
MCGLPFVLEEDILFAEQISAVKQHESGGNNV